MSYLCSPSYYALLFYGSTGTHKVMVYEASQGLASGSVTFEVSDPTISSISPETGSVAGKFKFNQPQIQCS